MAFHSVLVLLIEILAPEDCTKDYYNRKGYHSIILQAIADHRYCFTDINIGWPGSVHDARVFKIHNSIKGTTKGHLFLQLVTS